MTQTWVVREIEQQLRDHFQDQQRFGTVFTQLDVSVAVDLVSVFVRVQYSDGRISETTFEGNVDVADVDDIVAVLKDELSKNGADVFDRMWDASQHQFDPNWDSWTPATPFPAVTHQRVPTEPVWGERWIPDGPLPSIREPVDADYKYVGEDAYNQVGVRDGRDGGIIFRANSWTGESPTVELTAEQAKKLVRIIEAHLPDFESVGEDAYYDVGVWDGRDGGASIRVSSGDSYARVELTAQQAKELIRIIKDHLPGAE